MILFSMQCASHRMTFRGGYCDIYKTHLVCLFELPPRQSANPSDLPNFVSQKVITQPLHKEGHISDNVSFSRRSTLYPSLRRGRSLERGRSLVSDGPMSLRNTYTNLYLLHLFTPTFTILFSFMRSWRYLCNVFSLHFIMREAMSLIVTSPMSLMMSRICPL
jgi:hypothetical protein